MNHDRIMLERVLAELQDVVEYSPGQYAWHPFSKFLRERDERFDYYRTAPAATLIRWGLRGSDRQDGSLCLDCWIYTVKACKVMPHGWKPEVIA